MPRKKRPPEPDDQSSKRQKASEDTRIPKAELRVVQTKLDNIIRFPKLKIEIATICLNMHKLAILSYQFVALYLTRLLQDNDPIFLNLTFDDSWFIDVVRTVAYATDPSKTQKPKKFRTPKNASEEQLAKKRLRDQAISTAKTHMDKFTNEHFRQVVPKNDPIDIVNLSNQMTYLATEMRTALYNNICEHYDDYLRAFISCVDPNLEKIGRYVNAIKNREPLPELAQDHPLQQHVEKLTPPGALIDNYVGYDITKNWHRYIPCMYYMLKKLEENKDDNRPKMYQLFPLRTSIIPKSVHIDTACLNSRLRVEPYPKTIRYINSNVKECQAELWNYYFKTEQKCFGTGDVYRFDFEIITDAVSCSIQQKLWSEHPQYRKLSNDDKLIPTCPYIDKIDLKKYSEMQVVGIDPGVQDLLYCSKPKDVDVTDLKRKNMVDKFRYSARQRQHEMGTKKFNGKRKLAINNEPLIEGKTVQQWQHELSFQVKKTTQFDVLLQYIKKKNKVNKKLLNFWSKEQFRLWKWNAKVNKRRSEDRMIQEFKTRFGPPETTLVAMGDWSRGQKLKFGGPSKGKSFRTLFTRFGYKVALVHEYRTSKMCYDCHSETKNGFRKAGVERPKREPSACPFSNRCDGCLDRDNERKEQTTNPNRTKKQKRSGDKIHGLLVCKTCKTFWNRDLNGSLNIGLVAREYLAGRERPEYLQRPVDDKNKVVATEKCRIRQPINYSKRDLNRDCQIGE